VVFAGIGSSSTVLVAVSTPVSDTEIENWRMSPGLTGPLGLVRSVTVLVEVRTGASMSTDRVNDPI
jgi:hypothetical protein